MGWFGSKPKKTSLKVIELRQGTQIPMEQVDETFIQYARDNAERVPSIGHVVPVYVGVNGNTIAVYHEGKKIGQMQQSMYANYADEFKRLQLLGCIGKTDAYVKWQGSKSPHSLALNWGVRANDGGVLPDIRISL
jgi:hypothetical protein